MIQHLKRALSARTSRFVVVGVTNTIIDFLALNLLIEALDLDRLPANIVSVTVAMTFSFFANRHFVFRANSGSKRRQVLLFVGGTLFSLYIVQSIVILGLTEWWLGPADLAWWFVQTVGLDSLFNYEFVVTNFAKVVATGITMVINYHYYKGVAFTVKKTKS